MVFESGKRVFDFAIPMLESLDTARSLSYAIALRHGYESVLEVLDLPMHFGAYPLERIRREYESHMLLRKIPNIFGADLEAVAIGAFLKAEEQCRAINQRGWSRGRLSDDGHLEYRITRILGDILGPAPSLSTLSKLASWGPGATFALSRKNASPELKTIRESGITLGLLRRITCEGSLVGFLPPDRYELTPGGRVTTVPKSVKTDRTIVVEPGINAFFQSGLGAFIRQKLSKCLGIDIRNAADRHRLRCCLDWRTIATIDLKAASDTISSWLLTLFPMDWFDLLCDLRSERVLLNGEWLELEKVSSMGNGFTFELETLLFAVVCLASGVRKEDLSVFGDDIIVPRSQALLVMSNLEMLGFVVNTEKTFFEGDFVESCGVHCYQGVDLAPFQLKDYISDGLQAINIANKVRAFSWLSADGAGCDRRYLSVWRLCRRWIPDALLAARGPYGISGVLWSSYSEIPNLTYGNTWAVDGKEGLLIGTYRTTERLSNHPRLLQHRLRFMEDAFDTYIPNYGVRAIEPWIEKFKDPSTSTQRGNAVKQRKKASVVVTRFTFSQRWVQPGDWIVPAL